MNRFFTWLLILTTLHVPVYLPDTDGECRGAPIGSLIEAQAWHPVLLGVRPNDDIDRGPIRTDDEQESAFDGSQFGDVAILRGASAMTPCSVALWSVASFDDNLRVEQNCFDALRPKVSLAPVGRSVCICYCLWQV